jgi:hypothetical protein
MTPLGRCSCNIREKTRYERREVKAAPPTAETHLPFSWTWNKKHRRRNVQRR